MKERSSTALRGIGLTVFALLLFSNTPAEAQRSYSEWEPGGRKHAYVHDLVGTGALVSTVVSSSIDQFQNDPPQWGVGVEGFGRRFGSNAARRVVQESVRHGLAAVLHRSVRYQPCTCKNVAGRIGNALLETVTDRDRSGDRMIAIPRFTAVYAGALAESTWRPDDTGVEIVSIGLSSIVFGAIGNLSKEFLRFGN